MRKLSLPSIAALCLLLSWANSCGAGSDPSEPSGTQAQNEEGVASGPAVQAGSPGEAELADAEIEQRLRLDPRVADLIYDCSNSFYYDRDTSDMLPVLVEKLRSGQTDPLHRAKEELALLADRAIDALEIEFDKSYGQPMSSFGVLKNTVDTLGMSKPEESPRARELLMSAALHPQETIAIAAITGLGLGHAQPEDYDDLRQRLALPGTRTIREALAQVLYVADTERACLEFLDWFESGTNAELWASVATGLLSSDSPEVIARARGMWTEVPPALRAILAGVAASDGDAGARSFLQSELVRDELEFRTRALQVLAEIGALPELGACLQTDANATMRLLAAQGLVDIEGDREEAESLLLGALQDASAEVVEYCMGELVARGNPDAVDRALHGLRGRLPELDVSVRSLRRRTAEDPELAQRAWVRLRERWQSELHLPLNQRLATLQAIGMTPNEEAQRFLYGLALELDLEPIEGLRAHRWVCMQIANAGVIGRELLLGQLASERDPVHRLDLIWAYATLHGDEQVREALLTLSEDESLHPLERLFSAGRLVRVGPSHEIAPRLKRACLRIEHSEVRSAMQCMLWKWY